MSALIVSGQLLHFYDPLNPKTMSTPPVPNLGQFSSLDMALDLSQWLDRRLKPITYQGQGACSPRKHTFKTFTRDGKFATLLAGFEECL